MAFYSPDARMGQHLATLAALLQRQRPGCGSDSLALTWLRFPQTPQSALPAPADLPLIAGSPERVQPCGASWRGEQLQEPGALVALPYLIAVEQWLREDRLQEEPELRRALKAMARQGSVDALSFVLDRLSGTTSGPALLPSRRHAWERQRLLVNAWLAELGWSELEGINACHKTWVEGPYGRDRQFLDGQGAPGNLVSSEGLARLLLAVIEGTLVSPPACGRLCSVLLQESSPQGWLTQDLAGVDRRWGLADGGAAGIQEAVYLEPSGGRAPQLLVLLASGAAWHDQGALLAELGHNLLTGQAESASAEPT
jgi:hypothetical protein